jgi:hypothetical protein
MEGNPAFGAFFIGKTIKIIDNCYDPKLITGPKTFHIQNISILFDLIAPCLSRR